MFITNNKMLVYNIILVILIIGIIWLVYNYNYNKSNNSSSDNLVGSMGSVYPDVSSSDANSFHDQTGQLNKEGMPYINDLLPQTTNTEWSQFNPNLTGEIDNINKYKSGFLRGIDSVGSSMRNANQQIRSEPPNPIVPTGPWNQSTIQPDFVRIPLEIGIGTQ